MEKVSTEGHADRAMPQPLVEHTTLHNDREHESTGFALRVNSRW